MSESWIEVELKAAIAEDYRPAPWLLSTSIAAVRRARPGRPAWARVAGIVAFCLHSARSPSLRRFDRPKHPISRSTLPSTRRCFQSPSPSRLHERVLRLRWHGFGCSRKANSLTYVDLKSAKSARDLGLLILWQRGTRRMNREELIQSVHRQRRSVTLANARAAVSRLSDVVDDDGQGNLRLRNAGFREVDELIAQIDKTPVRRRKRSKRRINREQTSFHLEGSVHPMDGLR